MFTMRSRRIDWNNISLILNIAATDYSTDHRCNTNKDLDTLMEQSVCNIAHTIGLRRPNFLPVDQHLPRDVMVHMLRVLCIVYSDESNVDAALSLPEANAIPSPCSRGAVLNYAQTSTRNWNSEPIYILSPFSMLLA